MIQLRFGTCSVTIRCKKISYKRIELSIFGCFLAKLAEFFDINISLVHDVCSTMNVNHVECGIRRQIKGEISNTELFWLIFAIKNATRSLMCGSKKW